MRIQEKRLQGYLLAVEHEAVGSHLFADELLAARDVGDEDLLGYVQKTEDVINAVAVVAPVPTCDSGRAPLEAQYQESVNEELATS